MKFIIRKNKVQNFQIVRMTTIIYIFAMKISSYDNIMLRIITNLYNLQKQFVYYFNLYFLLQYFLQVYLIHNYKNILNNIKNQY